MMSKKKVLDSNGNPVRGIYKDELRTGTTWYIRLDVNGVDKFMNVTKSHRVTNLSQAKKAQRELLISKNEIVTDSRYVNELIEAYIKTKKPNPRFPNRGQDVILHNRYKCDLHEPLKYVKVSRLSNTHMMQIKAALDARKVGQESFNKIKVLLKASLKETDIDFNKLFRGFEAIPEYTEANKQKFPIDEIITGHLEDALQSLYNYFIEQLNKAKTAKEVDKYNTILFLLLTARRPGEPSLYKVSDIEIIDSDKDLYKIMVRPETNKEGFKGEVLVPKIVTPFIKKRIISSKNDYIFQADISTIDYTVDKALRTLALKRKTGLGAHLFRSLLRNILMDREISIKPINYLMSRNPKQNVDERFYDAHLTEPQRFIVYKTARLYEKIACGLESKIAIDYSVL